MQFNTTLTQPYAHPQNEIADVMEAMLGDKDKAVSFRCELKSLFKQICEQKWCCFAKQTWPPCCKPKENHYAFLEARYQYKVALRLL